MKKLLLALVSMTLALVSPAVAQQAVVVPATTNSIPITGTVAAATVVVAGVAGKSIYVTALVMTPAATSVVTFTQGTGAGCGTNTLNVTGALTGVTNINHGSGYGAVFALLPGNSLCVTIATAVAPGAIAYAQF